MPNHTSRKPSVELPLEKLAYDIKSAAAAIDVSPKSIMRLIKRGELRSSKEPLIKVAVKGGRTSAGR